MTVSKKGLTIAVDIRVEEEPFPVERAPIRTLVRRVLSRFGILDAQVDILLAGDATMKAMHQRFLQDGRTTDVISFNLSEPGRSRRCFQIAVNTEMALRQARRYRHSPRAELSLYLIHGLLHNLGFDDADPSEAVRMHRMERVLLNSFGCEGVRGLPRAPRPSGRKCS